jgi:hypothetical protein
MSSLQTSFRLPQAMTIPTHIEHNGQKIPVPPAIRDNVRILFNGVLDLNQAVVKLKSQLAKAGGTTTNNITNNSTTVTNAGASFTTPDQAYFFGPGIFLPISAISRGTGSSWEPSDNRVNVVQFTLAVTFQISKISINVIANSIGDFGGFGIYSADGNTLLVDSGPMALGSVAVVTSSITSISLAPGTYNYAQTGTTTTATLNTTSSVGINDANLMNANAAAPRYAIAANASAGGQLPASLGALTAVSNTTTFDTALVMFEP